MPRVLYERDGRIARITLNRPEVMNAIDDELPIELETAVEKANMDPKVHVIVLAGAGRAFCAGYDLGYYAQAAGTNAGVQKMPWDPMRDYAFMMKNTERFMSLFRSHRPVIAKVHGFAIAAVPISRCAAISSSWLTMRRSATCPRACGAVRQQRCGCIGSVPNVRSACCSLATRSTDARLNG